MRGTRSKALRREADKHDLPHTGSEAQAIRINEKGTVQYPETCFRGFYKKLKREYMRYG